MALPSTYLTLEQLKRARSAQRGERFNQSAQQASQSVRMGLDDIRKIRMEDEARAQAAKQAQAQAEQARRQMAIREEQNRLQSENLRLQGDRMKQAGAAQASEDAAALAANPREQVTPGEYDAAVGGMMGAVGSGATEAAAKAASNQAFRKKREWQRTEQRKDDRTLAQNVASEASAEKAWAGADKARADIGQGQQRADAATMRAEKAKDHGRRRAGSGQQALPYAEQKALYDKGEGPAPRPLDKKLQADPVLRRKLSGLNSMNARLMDIDQMADTLETGRSEAILFDVANFFGVPDPQKAAFVSETGENFAQYVKGLSGAAASDKEIVRLLKNMPTLRDPKAVFKAKLSAIRRGIALTINEAIDAEIAGGAPVGRLKKVEVPPIYLPDAGGDGPAMGLADFAQAASEYGKALASDPTLSNEQRKQMLRDWMRANRPSGGR